MSRCAVPTQNALYLLRQSSLLFIKLNRSPADLRHTHLQVKITHLTFPKMSVTTHSVFAVLVAMIAMLLQGICAQVNTDWCQCDGARSTLEPLDTDTLVR